MTPKVTCWRIYAARRTERWAISDFRAKGGEIDPEINGEVWQLSAILTMHAGIHTGHRAGKI